MTTPLDFSMVPPEVNSGLMYSGPGSEPTLTVAGAWDKLAAELRSAADSYASVISNLSDEWQGPASEAMAAAAEPQLVWMNTAAAQAEQTATQAAAWAGAYDAAFSMSVPPPVIAANRSLFTSLIQSNIFGQNASAIMATEAQYEQMWAQDAAAMNGYAGSAAAAANLTPFTAPGQATSPAGSAGQSAAVARAAATQAGSDAQTTLDTTSTAGSGSTPTGLAGLVDQIFGTDTPIGEVLNSQFFNTASSTANNGMMAFANTGSLFASMAQLGQSAGGAAAAAGDAAGAAGQAATGGLGALGAVSAGLGRGASLGAMSVPPSWALNPAATPFEPPLGLTPLRTPNAYAEGMPAMALPGGTPFRGPGRPEPEYGFKRLRFMTRPPAAG